MPLARKSSEQSGRWSNSTRVLVCRGALAEKIRLVADTDAHLTVVLPSGRALALDVAIVNKPSGLLGSQHADAWLQSLAVYNQPPKCLWKVWWLFITLVFRIRWCGVTECKLKSDTQEGALMPKHYSRGRSEINNHADSVLACE